MSFHDQQYNEKRNFIRMQIDTQAYLQVSDGGERLAVVCQDLSSTGAQLQSAKPLELGTEVELQIPSPTPQHQGLNARGKVVRCQSQGPGVHILGLTFDSVS
ncbi:MAG: PilZ domain-containing protein [Halopseudomonas yangmingensis]|uniref:PilZ domain-containing protein n=1 Tax=Halopseudomonas yangmingensis TaxID=1720063 RepID=A0A1I4NJ17_9GAMM|nr:PilZ domain-containing protein [Halopseudomonas yangmingensis]SFM15163.1 PilZ domain-containing protein [Halopseudomonas yangmingensis]